MKHVAVVAAAFLAVGLACLCAVMVRAEQSGEKLPVAKLRDEGAPPSSESATPPAPPTPPAAPPATPAEPSKSPVSAKPAEPAKSAAPGKAAPAGAAKSGAKSPNAPPPPVADVEIPPIPEVDKDPFKPGPPPVRKKKSDVIEEGKRLFEREGRLEMDPLGRPFFVFDSGDKPMQILENSFRELIEAATDHGKKHAKWRISGTVTVYEGTNYLLLTRCVRILAEQENL